MSNNENNASATNNPETMNRNRRGSVGNAVFSNLFQRSSTTTGGSSVFPATAMNMNDPNRRRLSVSTLGIHGTSPTNSGAAPYQFRRGSMSTNSDSIDENAIEDDDVPLPSSARTAPSTPFTRRMSFGANRTFRNGGGVSPATGNDYPATPATPATPANTPHGSLMRRASVQQPSSTVPPVSLIKPLASSARRASTIGVSSPQAQASNGPHKRSLSNMKSPRPDQGAFNWSEQLRTRAESSVAGARPSFSFGSGMSTSPPRGPPAPIQERAKSVSDMPAPPSHSPKPKAPERRKPDPFQERILKGDFYMD